MMTLPTLADIERLGRLVASNDFYLFAVGTEAGMRRLRRLASAAGDGVGGFAIGVPAATRMISLSALGPRSKLPVETVERIFIPDGDQIEVLTRPGTFPCLIDPFIEYGEAMIALGWANELQRIGGKS